MRTGRVFRRCTKCGRAMRPGACASCGCDRFTWTFVVDLAPPGAKRRQKSKSGFTTKSQAIAAMATLQTTKASGTYVEPTKLTVATYLDQWLAARNGLRANTRRDYRVAITKHINPRIGDVPLQSLGRLQVKGLYQALAATGLAPKTVHNVHICLRKALGDAAEDGLVRRNVAERAHAKPKDRPEMLTWTGDELAAFLDLTAQDRDFPLYQLAAATGMRRGELLGLRWRDVDFEGRRVSIRQQWTRQGSGLAFGPPKSEKSKRTIDLDADTLAILRERRERQLFERRAWGNAYRIDLDLVFCDADGSPQDPNVVGRRFGRRVCSLSMLPVIGLHGLRHTHATLLLEDGVDVKTVSERLGHDSVQTTLELYGHVTPRMRASAAARFGSLLSRARLVEQMPAVDGAL